MSSIHRSNECSRCRIRPLSLSHRPVLSVCFFSLFLSYGHKFLFNPSLSSFCPLLATLRMRPHRMCLCSMLYVLWTRVSMCVDVFFRPMTHWLHWINWTGLMYKLDLCSIIPLLSFIVFFSPFTCRFIVVVFFITILLLFIILFLLLFHIKL